MVVFGLFIMFLCLLVLLILLVVFLLSPVTVTVIYDRNFQKNEVDVKVEMWRRLLHYEKKVKIGEPVGGAKKGKTESKQEEPSIDDMDGSFRVIAKSLNDLKEYGENAKEFTSDIQLTSLEISLSYGAEDAPKTAMATGILWGIVSTAVAFLGHFFQLIVVPKTEVIPYFMMKKPLELHIGCIGKVRMANAIKAIWKLARFMQKKKQLHNAGKQSHKGKNQMA
jgi:hypothetical protein